MALVPNPTPGTVLTQGIPQVPSMVPATGNAGLDFNARNAALAAQSGLTVQPNGAIIGTEAAAGPGDTVVQMADGSKTILKANGLVVTVPGAPAPGPAPSGGGGHGPPPLALPPPPTPQAIPGPKKVGASKLGAPNQTWDWLLEALAAPGLLSPMMQQLGMSLAQPATSNDMLPQISQPNFGGLFGTPTSPAPFTQTQMPSFMQSVFGNTPWQGSTLGPSFASRGPMLAPAPSGNLNLGSLFGLGPSSGLNPQSLGGSGLGGLPANLIGTGPAGGSRK